MVNSRHFCDDVQQSMWTSSNDAVESRNVMLLCHYKATRNLLLQAQLLGTGAGADGAGLGKPYESTVIQTSSRGEANYQSHLGRR